MTCYWLGEVLKVHVPDLGPVPIGEQAKRNLARAVILDAVSDFADEVTAEWEGPYLLLRMANPRGQEGLFDLLDSLVDLLGTAEFWMGLSAGIRVMRRRAASVLQE